ncbi:carbohydrate binding domain-containing protein [Rothia nasimurium]|uniref:carbohydrate binding domain-containing protein n=1 Tax=Rothia nasimurium TaxID=85336 RepID=UPI001F00E566|nr:carbohydrate binding domain-containing protein [Rothia nasimurium]
MVKVIDQRPTRVDSLRKLITQVKTPASVPHGVKVARPGEGVRFFDSEGAGHLWDGDAIAAYDARMSEAETKLAEAETALEQASAELEDAKGRIDAAGGDLSAYIEKVETAQAAATKAANDLKALDSRLASADTDLKALTSRVGTTEARAGELSTAVDNALTQSSSAGSLASEAMGKAEEAASEAARVSADAANAVSAAEEAERKALEAAGIAGGKGKVIYSSSAPTGADQNASNLWIRSSDNRPHRWSGSAWVAVTDKVATDAASAASAAQAKAVKAEQDAARAQAAADQAKAEAAAAQASAVSADGKAQQAIASAQQAQGTADKAVSDAAKAASAASAADQKALDAAGLAGSKGKVIYSATAPTGADQVGQNLWIRTSDNRPHRWSGSAWVAVTDKVATDAAASAASANALATQAKAAADKAQADATAAATAAQDAMRAANQAQDSANGKNTVSYTTGNPAGVGTRVGDTHYKVNATGTVLQWWRWSGSAWVEQALDGQVISSLDAGKITAGWLDAARIKAGSITTNKLMVGIGPNLFPPLSAEHIDGAVSPTQWRVDETGGIGGVTALVVKPGVNQSGSYPGVDVNFNGRPTSPYFIPVQPGQKYRVSVWVKGSQASTGSQTAAVYGRIYGEAGGTSYVWATPSSFRGPITTGWTQLVGFFTVPEDTGSRVRPTRLAVGFYTNGSYPGECWFSSPEVMAMTPGDLIVNGSITGEQVNAQSVGAAVGQFVQVKAQNVEVTGELASRMVNAMSAQVKNLVVTDSAILQHAVLLGSTVAEQLNVTKKLVARDAIVNGTLDVAQLNVTSGMAAAIVNAMDINAKRLVVTEDAILQRATVIQGLVTPELIAQKISVQDLGAKLISTTALQTDLAVNRGVKITSTGYKAWDDAGNLTVDLNGENNVLIGNLATNKQGGSGIKITQTNLIAAIDFCPPTYAESTKNWHGSIWYSAASRLSERSLTIGVTDYATHRLTDPAIHLMPNFGEIAFQGKFTREGSSFAGAMRNGTIEASSMGPNGWVTFKVTYPTPMTSGASIAVFISPINANGVECAVGIKQSTPTGFEAVVKNVSGRDSGYQWIKYLSIAT